MSNSGPGRTVRRTLSDDTLLVFLSDCHIGGDAGRDIFESPDDLTALFDDLDRHAGPVELVLAGDFFDFLRLVHVPAGENRAVATISRPEYRALFGALRKLAAGKDRRVFYMPGNHDAEAWWNAAVREEILREGLAHEFTLSYAATFASAPDRVVYCEHGNEFDESNMIGNYDDALDTPLGHHVVTEIIPRLPTGSTASVLRLSEIDHVFPLSTIPQWAAGRMFYALVTQAVRWLLIPLLVLYVGFEVLAYFVGIGGRAIENMFASIVYYSAIIILAFALFFFLARRIANRAIRNTPPRNDEPSLIRGSLQRGDTPPLGTFAGSDVAVWISGHTHAPALEEFRRQNGEAGVIVNSGCWLRQLQPTKAHLRAPAVFVNRFVQTHVRISLHNGAVNVELWEWPRPSAQDLLPVERLAILGRLPAEPEKGAPPRVVASASVGRSDAPTARLA
jgi:UDP-2,3-diacylglucosamine pyrophosphatase LpxH